MKKKPIIPFDSLKSTRLASVVDKSYSKTESTTRYIYRTQKDELYELNYVYKANIIIDTIVNKINNEDFEKWGLKYLPHKMLFSSIFENLPVDEKDTKASHSLYRCSDGRYFEIERKRDSENKLTEYVIWLSPEKVDLWKSEHSNLPHRDTASD